MGPSSDALKLDRLADKLADPPLPLAGVEFPDASPKPLTLATEDDFWKS
jgi:hypothetical protein